MSTRTVLIGGYVLIAIALLTCQWAASRSAARVARIGDIVSATKRRRAGWGRARAGLVVAGVSRACSLIGTGLVAEPHSPPRQLH